MAHRHVWLEDLLFTTDGDIMKVGASHGDGEGEGEAGGITPGSKCHVDITKLLADPKVQSPSM